MKPMLLMLATATMALASCAQVQQAPSKAAINKAAINAAIASPDRPPADTQRDAQRKPAELLAFAGIKPGDQVADIMPGNGYFTRIFSKVVGPDGRVFAVVPTEFLKLAPKAAGNAQAIHTEPAYANVQALTTPAATLTTPAPLDVAWTSDNYHDVYGFLGADTAAQLDAGVFKALKPGGVFIVIDHVAKAGTSGTSAHTLHRIDPETVKAQALAAGFTLEAESTVLRNPADAHDVVIFSPVIRGHTDQFVLKFRKPLS